MVRDDDIERTILESFVKSQDFNGIPASGLARALDTDWGQLQPRIAALIRARKIDAAFASHSVNPHIKRLADLPVEVQIKMLAVEQAAGICFYPSAEVVKAMADLSRYDGLPYSLRLALGEAQLTPVFFELCVLERYFRDPRYSCRFHDRAGSISVQDEHYLGDQMAERDKVLLQSFGIGYDEKRSRVVVAYLRYLADLSSEHQQIWKAHENGGKCTMNSDYERSSIHGMFPEHYSVYEAFIQEQREINNLSQIIGKPPLFRATFEERKRPLEFSPMLRPTLRNLQEFALTLDKMLSENLNREFFRADIPLEDRIAAGGGSVEVRQLGTITLLGRWLDANYKDRDGNDVGSDVVEPLREVRKARQPTAHSLSQDAYDLSLPSRQDALLVAALRSLQKLRLIFSSHTKASGYSAPDWLDGDKIVSY
ncbi:MAG: hypothetical protein WA254_12150 [Candidatus Sulfotelmatobacter sp.]